MPLHRYEFLSGWLRFGFGAVELVTALAQPSVRRGWFKALWASLHRTRADAPSAEWGQRKRDRVKKHKCYRMASLLTVSFIPGFGGRKCQGSGNSLIALNQGEMEKTKDGRTKDQVAGEVRESHCAKRRAKWKPPEEKTQTDILQEDADDAREGITQNGNDTPPWPCLKDGDARRSECGNKAGWRETEDEQSDDP